jgi:hypothetical protein
VALALGDPGQPAHHVLDVGEGGHGRTIPLPSRG